MSDSMKKARRINVFYGHVLAGILFSLAGVWISTQYCAYSLGYNPKLGHILFVVNGYPIYEPLGWWFWAYQFEPYAPWVFERASWITYGTFAIMSMVMVIMAIRRTRVQKNHGTYGTSKWASTNDLKEAGLFSSKGVFLAQTNDAEFKKKVDEEGEVKLIQKKNGTSFIRHNGPEHVIAVAPTRKGKGVGMVIPTLLTWMESVLIYDIKKENWEITSGWRSHFSHCLKFEPTDLSSIHYNPIYEIRKGLNEVRDVQNIADILVDPEGSTEKRDHWEKTGHSLLVGAILHVLYAEKNKSLNGVANFLSNPDETIEQTILKMVKTKHLGDKVHPVIASIGRELFNKSANELSGVISTTMGFLSLYRDPIIAQNTSKSDFAISDLMNSDKPVSLYLVIPPSDAERLKPLIRLMLNQIGRRLTETMESNGERVTGLFKHKCLFMLDEFPALGRLSFFESELAYMAGYGIKAFLIVQSLNQLDKAYGPNNSILDNCHVRVMYGASDERAAERISKLLGETTEVRRQMNFTGSRLAPWLSHVMESEQESARALLTVGEVLQLPSDEALVLVGEMSPYRAKKVTYYQDSRFKGRAFLKTPDIESEHKGLSKINNEWETPFVIEAEFQEKISDINDDEFNIILEEETGEGLNRHQNHGQTPHDFNLTKEPLIDDNHHQLQQEEQEKRIEADRTMEIENQEELKQEEKEKEIEKKFDDQLKKRQLRGRLRELGRDDYGGGLPL